MLFLNDQSLFVNIVQDHKKKYVQPVIKNATSSRQVLLLEQLSSKKPVMYFSQTSLSGSRDNKGGHATLVGLSLGILISTEFKTMDCSKNVTSSQQVVSLLRRRVANVVQKTIMYSTCLT